MKTTIIINRDRAFRLIDIAGTLFIAMCLAILIAMFVFLVGTQIALWVGVTPAELWGETVGTIIENLLRPGDDPLVF